MKFSTIINGIDVNASFSESNIQDLFFPLLQHLSALHSEKQRRILVMLAAPPGAGKSTLVSFLEHLAADAVPGKSVQAIGMDGFHRRQEYLLMHTASVDGKEIPMFGFPLFQRYGIPQRISEFCYREWYMKEDVVTSNMGRNPYYDFMGY